VEAGVFVHSMEDLVEGVAFSLPDGWRFGRLVGRYYEGGGFGGFHGGFLGRVECLVDQDADFVLSYGVQSWEIEVERGHDE
jgi:hypothetical protein